MIKIFGIPNCDTVQKTIKYLKANEIEYEFYDFKKNGITEKHLKKWLQKVPLEKLLNKASATYKALADNEKPTNEAEAISLMIAKPSAIKRPVIEKASITIVGYDETQMVKFKSLPKIKS